MSQQPDMTAPRWPEPAPGGNPYAPQGDAEPTQVEQDWNAPRAPQQQVPWGAPQAQAQPPQGGYPAEQGYPGEDPSGPVPTEFDHLFRDSSPDSRRSIDRNRPAVGNTPGNFAEAQAPVPAPYEPAPPQQAEYQQGGYQQPDYQQADAQPQYQQPGQYGQADYQQYGGYNGEQNPQAGYPNQGPTVQYGWQPDQPQYGPPGQWTQGPGPGGPGGGGGGNKRALLIGGGVVAVVAVIGLVLGLGGGGGGAGAATPTASASSTAAPKETGRQQADQILALIQESGPLRQDASGAVVDLVACQSLDSVQSTLTTTTSTRTSQASKVSSLDVSQISNGDELVQALNTAWTASAASDNAYKQIAADVQSGCSPAAIKADPNYATAQQQGNAATQAKEKAARLWNADATALGEKTITYAML